MNRWVWFSICALFGPVMVTCGLLVPAHLRAVDVSVLNRAGRRTVGLIEQGLALAHAKQVGAAQLVCQAAQQQHVPDCDKLASTLADLAREHPAWSVWGGGDYHLQVLFATDPGLPKSAFEPFTAWVVRLENRGTVLELLRGSTRPVVQELLRCRALTNTVVFDPAGSSSGQALDAALSVCGLLLEERNMSGGLSNAVFVAAAGANRGAAPQPLEQILLDLMSLGQRLNWGQLAAFVSRIEDAETLRLLAVLVRRAENQLPVIFSAIQLSGRPAQVARYLMDFSQTGLQDLGASLRYGTGAVKELLRRNQRLYVPRLREQITAFLPLDAFVEFTSDYAWLMPWFSVAMKWAFLLGGGFLVAMALHYARPLVPALEKPLQVAGFHVAREVLFGLGLLFLVLLFTEPFLSQGSQRVEFPFRLRFPTLAGVVPAGTINLKSSFMNEKSLLTLLLFFVLQGLIYIACLVKLAEVRRQRVPARMKLKLLENEDHLFDAGLYLGFVGTIISLILFSLGVIKPSLMAAYSSTSFGIIFVSFFKIFNLRPLRRQLLLEAEAASPEAPGPVGARPLASLS